MTIITTKQPTASKSTLSKGELQVLDLLIEAFPSSKLSEDLATASESEREAILAGLFKNLNLGLDPQGLRDPIALTRQLKIFLKIFTAAKKPSLEELEALWQENKQKDVLDDPKFRKLAERPPTLRCPDFAKELTRLSVATGDERFFDAVKALIEHRIIDEKGEFTRWRHPIISENEAQNNRTMLEAIRNLKKAGRSTSRACAEIAALYGVRAGSFDAAIKQLKLLYSPAGKKGAA